MKLLAYAFLVATLIPASMQAVPAADEACLNRTLAINVQTEDTQPVAGLASSNFRGKVHGKAIQIVSANYDTSPHRIVILLDASGSMQAKWEFALKLAYQLVSLAPKGTAFSLLTFSRQLEDQSGFTENPTDVLQFLTKLQAKDIGAHRGVPRKTALLDSILAAVTLLRPAARGDAIFLVTDGGENTSESRENDVKNALLQSGARLFAFTTEELYMTRGVTMGESVGPDGLRQWAKATGGICLTFPPIQGFEGSATGPPKSVERLRDTKTIPWAAHAMGGEIFEFYSLQIKLPEGLKKSTDWNLEALDANGKRNIQWQIIYPHKLAPCL